MKLKLTLAAIALALTAPFAAQAQESCLDEALVQEIRTKIDLKTKDAATFDRCNPETNTYKILEALIVVKTLQFEETNLAEPFSQHILSNDFWTYFSGRASAIIDEGQCRSESVLAYVYGFFRDGQIHICPTFYKDPITKFERAETMLHEVRHFEGFGHVTCTRGPRKGNAGACDESVHELGSYAVTVETLTKMAMNAKGVARAQKTMLKILALTYANETFNEPIRPRDLSAFFLVDENKRSYIYSDKGLLEVAPQPEARFISRRMALAVFPLDRSDAYTANVFSTQLDVGPAMGSASIEYNATPISERKPILDIANMESLSGILREKQADFTLMNKDDAKVHVDFGWTAKAMFSSQEYGAADGDLMSTYILNDQNEMYRLKVLGNQSYTLTPVENTLGSFRQVTIFNGDRLALDEKGRIQIEKAGDWALFAPLQGLKVTQITRPFLWDQYFEDVDNSSVIP